MSELSDQLQDLIELVQVQQQSIERLIQAMEGARPPASGSPATAQSQKRKPGPVDWLKLSGQERLNIWHELASFVETLVGRYNLQLEILPCWWQHKDAVDELTALWQFRQATFREGADLKAPMGWQDILNRSRDRMRSMFVSCREGHVDTAMESWMHDDIKAAFYRAVEADVSENRGDQ